MERRSTTVPGDPNHPAFRSCTATFGHMQRQKTVKQEQVKPEEVRPREQDGKVVEPGTSK